MAGLSQVRNVEDCRFEPTIGNESQFTLTYDGSDNLIRIDRKIGQFTYRKTLTWTAGNLIYISEWTKL